MFPVNLNETSPDQHGCSPAKKISILFGYCFIFLGSFFGNSLIIIIVFKHRELRKTVNYFIVNMAVSDLLFSLIATPHQIAAFVDCSWDWPIRGILGSTFCKLYLFTIQVSLLVSVQSLVWIAIDRFIAVVYPIKLGLISTKFRTIAIVSTWIVGGLFYFPSLITAGLIERGNNTFCTVLNTTSFFSNPKAGTGYNWLHLTFRFIAPLFLITILYTAIAISLKRQSKAVADTARIQRHCLKRRRQAIQMAVVIVFLFYLCIFPYALLRLKYAVYGGLSVFFEKPFYYTLALFMWFSSATVNPIICLSFVKSYRRGLRNILCSYSRRRRDKKAKREQIALKGIKNMPN